MTFQLNRCSFTGVRLFRPGCFGTLASPWMRPSGRISTPLYLHVFDCQSVCPPAVLLTSRTAAGQIKGISLWMKRCRCCDLSECNQSAFTHKHVNQNASAGVSCVSACGDLAKKAWQHHICTFFGISLILKGVTQSSHVYLCFKN